MKKKLLFIFALLCTVAQGAWAYDNEVSINDNAVSVPADKHWLVTGTGEVTGNKITIGAGATVTLSGVNISHGEATSYCIKCVGSATIILAEGTINTLTCTGNYSTALRPGGTGTTLTIQGTGTLKAQSGEKSAGIGAVSDAGGGGTASCGNIVIEGGTIEAKGGSYSAGIGSTWDRSCGDITIASSVKCVSATKGSGAAHCIGNGHDTCGKVTIGGVEYWDGSDYENYGADYIGQNELNIAFINNGAVDVPAGKYYNVIGTKEVTGNKITIGDGATVALSNVNIQKANDYCVKCNGSATIILKYNTVNELTSSGAAPYGYPALWVGGSGTKLTIQSEIDNFQFTGKLIAQGADRCAAIGGYVTGTCGDIEIQGGIITATGGYGAPGIGSGFSSNCGSITITSGVTSVTSTTGATYESALDCIGRGNNGSCGTVTIGGMVFYDGTNYQNHGDNYISRFELSVASVNKAAVTVPNSKYYLVIGDGNETGNQITLGTSSTAVLSNVNISNVNYCLKCEGDANVILADGTTNTLISTSNNYPAYPALWVGDAGTTTTIQGTGKLVAQGGAYCAAIGGGLHNTSNSCGNIRIEGGIIDATGSSNAVAIGADYAPDGNTQCGNITITNGVTSLIAKGAEGEGIDCIGRYAARSSCGTVTIGGVVYQSDDDYIGQHALYFLKGNGDGTGKYWTTYYDRETNLLASEGTQVFKAALCGIELTLTPISDRVVNSLQGVILKSSSDHFLLATRTGVSSDSYDGNVLTGTMTTITNPGPANGYNCYVLNKGDEGVGFYKLSDTGTIGAHKAYLKYNGVVGGAREFFGFDEATGLKDVIGQKEEGSGDYYDLQGRKVAQPSKGLYIVNGKKVVIK